MPGILGLMLLSMVVGAQTAVDKSTELRVQAEYRKISGAVQIPRLARDLEAIQALGSRTAGSAGEKAALDLAEKRFRELGLSNIRREKFSVTVPDPDATGVLQSNSGRWSVEVLPLWPNLVRTSTCDVEGPLLYGGSGSLEALAGKPVPGSIVVLEFNTGAAWRNAAKLGAKAIVFVEPASSSRGEGELKYSSVPLRIPRFYLPLRQAGPVLAAAQRSETVRLKCRQDWVTRESATVLADLPGTDPAAANERVLIYSFADAPSVVPKLAPGAEASTGMAALYEILRVAKVFPHRRPITAAVGGAHYLALQGAREFVESRLRTDKQPYLLCTTLDLSSGSPTLGSHALGWFLESRWEAKEEVRNIARTFRQHADRLAPALNLTPPRRTITDGVNESDNRTWKNNIPGKFAFDCEPFLQARYQALTFGTIEDARERVDTPFDTLENLNIANIARQVRTLTCLYWHLGSDTSAKTETSPFRVQLEPKAPVRMSLVGGFATVEGRVVKFDPLKSFVPDVSVPNSIVTVPHRQKSMMGVRGPIVQATEGERAQFRFIGLPPVNTFEPWDRRRVRLSCFGLDPVKGDIVIAPSEGLLSGGLYSPEFDLKSEYKSTPIVAFDCVATDLYDLTDPQDFTALQNARVLDAATDASPRYFGIFLSPVDTRLTSDVDDTAVLFTEAAQRWKILMGSGLGETRLILVNSTPEDPEGRGYVAPGGSPTSLEGRDSVARAGVIPNIPLQTALDIVTLNQSRLDKFAKYRIISPSVESIQSQARAESKLAQEALDKKDWAGAERHGRTAWGYGLRAHPVIQGTANDVVSGVVFYLFLLVPFSYFAERLFFARRELTKQLFAAGSIFVGAFIVLRLIHPAFEIVSNPVIIFIAFVMAALSLVVVGFIVSKFEASLKSLKALQSGIKTVDVGRMSVALAAFNLGVGNMRRRKARTFLTTLTLVVMTFIVLSLTSIVPELKVSEVPAPIPARYPGLLVRNPGLEPLQNATYRILQNQFSGRAEVTRRAWYYGADIRDNSTLTVSRADRIIECRAILGMEPAESATMRLNEALAPGGRWFRADDDDVIILPRPLAEQLKVDPADVGRTQVSFGGRSFTVIGIIDDAILRSVQDLDGDGVLPADFALSSRFQNETRSGADAFRKFLRLDPAGVFLLPLRTSLRLGAEIRSVSVSFATAQDAREALDRLMPRVRVNLYAAVPGESGLEVRMFSVRQGTKNTGLGLVLVQMAIAAVFVLNTMIASVYERTKEIGIFSAIGLAPNHIAVLFLAESCVYGVLGAVTGYFMAQGLARFVLATGSFPGLYLNFSAGSAVLAAGLVMGIVLLSTIYPARVASRIAAPAMEEDFSEEPPEGDTWEVMLPFSVGPAEAGALSQFLGEWLRSYEEYTIGDFVTSSTQIRTQPMEGGARHVVESVAWLAPFDLGVQQNIRLIGEPTATPGIYHMILEIERISGEPANWLLVNKRFLAHLRRQFLTWRTLDAEGRARYERAVEDSTPVGAIG